MIEAFNHLRRYSTSVYGVIHVGANEGAEAATYAANGVRAAVFIEPIPHIYEKMRELVEKFAGMRAVRAVCSEADGEVVDFNIASNGGLSSSFLSLGRHSVLHPDVSYVDQISMQTSRLDTLAQTEFSPKDYNLLVLDTQGTELKVLRGAVELLSHMDAVYAEISEVPLYEGGCTLDEVRNFLGSQGFRIKWLDINANGWGDALFISDTIGSRASREWTYAGVNIARGKKARQSSNYSSQHDASNAVNGVRTGEFNSHTQLEEGPWWEVDLERDYEVERIVVFNRDDCCQERARSLQVFIRSAAGAWEKVHDQAGVTFGGIHTGPLEVRLSGRTARWVKLSLVAKEWLHLDQVEIYTIGFQS